MPNMCPFCLKIADMSFEHLWGDWLNDVIPINRYRMIRRDQEGNVHTWPARKLKLGANVVCSDCNNRWMGDLENRSKSIISGMASECSPSILQARDIAVIAALTLTKAVVADAMCNPNRLTLSSVERSLFAERLEFPVGVQAWLASQSTLHGVFDNSYFEPPINTRGGSFKAQVFTYGIGHFVIQLTILRWKSKRRRKYANQLFFRQDPHWDDFSIPVWPSDGTVVSWPARKHLTHEFVEVFIQRWKHLNDRRN